MAGKAASVQLTCEMFEVLEQLRTSRTVGSSIKQRVCVILMAFEKARNAAIGQRLGLCGKCVGLWRRRWRESYPALLRMQFSESHAQFQRSIRACLSDAPRCGSPGRFAAEQIVGLIGISCEPPENSGRPVTSWIATGSGAARTRRARCSSISTNTPRTSPRTCCRSSRSPATG